MSVKVIIIKDKPIDQVVLTKDLTSIGRKSDSDIAIKDPAVSGNHAQIQKLGEHYQIEDLGSTNGLLVKGKKIRKQMLKHNDMIQVGEHVLKFLITAPAAARGNATAEKPINRVPTARVSASGDGFLQLVGGPRDGQKISLEDGLTTIGEPGIQVAAVSRRPQGHFIIHVDGGKDKDRVPLVNGEPTGFKSRKLESGDIVEVAGAKMEYHSV